jgi:hypothetical protein
VRRVFGQAHATDTRHSSHLGGSINSGIQCGDSVSNERSCFLVLGMSVDILFVHHASLQLGTVITATEDHGLGASINDDYR